MAFDPQFDDYISVDESTLFVASDGKKVKKYLLWGDGIRLTGNTLNGFSECTARGSPGWVKTSDLGGTSLLEYYYIDVGQGDGVLIKTPDFRHILIDGGYPRRSQPTGKSAADFVDWKFAKDYGTSTIALDAIISSHIDFDHYGGLDDILDTAQEGELDCTGVTVEAFYHSGLGHWAAHGGVGEGLGPYTASGGRKWFTRLLDDRASAVAATDTSATPKLRGAWRAFVEKIVAARRADGTPTHIERLSQQTAWLPGFGQGQTVAIRVLGPIGTTLNGNPALLRLSSEKSQNTNGTSVLLRFDYGASRSLLTGDLNANAHRELLKEYRGQELELAVDVAKSCHHGSEDVSFAFLNFVKAACTVISSGDDEGHDHPRPRIVAASGLSGYAQFDNDVLVTPLVYSTELARSVQVGLTSAVTDTRPGGQSYSGAALAQVRVDYGVTSPGALGAKRASRSMGGSRVMHKLLYGLVNIRTDGRRILAATMNEGDGSFTTKTFVSRFQP